MKKQLKFSQILSIGLLLFSIFFGAGNIIFPPILGQAAGTNMWIAIAGFIISDVGLSLMAIIAIVLVGGTFDNLTSKVHPKFSLFFAVVIYLVIGPFCVIPRTAVVSYEAIALPFIDKGNNYQWLITVGFTTIFFLITYLLSLNPSKLIDMIGKVITPLLLILIGVIVIKSIITPIGNFGEPIGEYINNPFFKGFINGYLTLDGLTALLVSVIVVDSIKHFGVKDSKAIAKNTIYSGLIAVIGLTIVYIALGYIGASSESLGVMDNGAELLAEVVFRLFGQGGIAILGVVVTLACLTTAIGITASFANYFNSISKNITYKGAVAGVCIGSLIISNLGLSNILKITEPILALIYPIAIVLIFVAFIDKKIKAKSLVYIGGISGVLSISIISLIEEFGIDIGLISNLVHKIPLYNLGIGWVIPGIIGCIIGYMIPRKIANKKVLA